MEKQGIIADGITPVEEQEDGTKSAATPDLAEHTTKRLAETAEQNMEKKGTCKSGRCGCKRPAD